MCGQTGKIAKKFCEGCPIKKEDKRFQKETLVALDERVGEEWKQFSFIGLQRAVGDIMDLEDAGDSLDWEVGTDMLVKIFRSEMNQYERGERKDMLAEIEKLRKKR